MKTVGFDFGTTNSLVSLIQGDRPINFFDDRGLPIPSVVCYEGPEPIVGRNAKERLANAGLGVYGNIVRSPKMLLGQESVFVDGVERSVIDIVADVLKTVRSEAIRSPGRSLESLDTVVAAIPISFEGRHRTALRDAFRKAGMRIRQFVHEPLAALYGYFKANGDLTENLRRYDRKLILVFDWGGGTLDLTLCRIENGCLLQVKNDGTDEVGGDLFDEALQHEVLREVRDARRFDESVRVHPDAMARLLHRCERGKIDLSTRNSIELYVDHFFRDAEDGDDTLEFTLTRDKLESTTKPLVDAGVNRINTLLESVNVSPAQVAFCLATGGMVNMPVIKSRLHEIFGVQRVHVSKKGGAEIAEGAAWFAHDNAKLQLAKQVELSLARNSFLPLIRSGTTMPSEREVQKDSFQLYSVDPRDGFAKFQIMTPVRPGSHVLPNDRRDVLGTMTLSIDSTARPFYERIILDISINDDLILHAHARSLMQKSEAQLEVHDLEFAVAIKDNPGDDGDQLSIPEIVELAAEEHEKGSVTIRANISDRKNPVLVPGELLYKHDPNYFDVRMSPPEIQVCERLYYEPCSKCGRAWNDPLCRCGLGRSASIA